MKVSKITITILVDIIMTSGAIGHIGIPCGVHGHGDHYTMSISEPKSVKIARDSSRTSSVKSTRRPEKPLGGWLRTWVVNHTQWIVKNWNWSQLKPVIRCAVVAWVAVVLFVIPRVEVFFGQVWGLLALLRYRTESI